MRYRKLAALVIISAIFASGCGSVKGTDALDVVDSSPTGSIKVSPSLTTQTRVEISTQDFLNRCLNGDFTSTYAQLILDDTTFINQDDFKEWFQNVSGITSGYMLTEYTQNNEKRMQCTCGSVTYVLSPVKQMDGSYKFVFNDFIARDWVLMAPTGMKLYVDGKDLSEIAGVKTELQDYDQYVIPAISNAQHSIKLTCSLAPDVETTVDNTLVPFDARAMIVLDNTARMTYIQNAFAVYKDLNDYIMKQDWNTFEKYFLPGVDVSKLSTAFYKGKEKADVYDYHCVGEARDLHLSDQDVRFLNDTTAEVTFGTVWTWAKPMDVKYDKNTGEVISVKAWQEMRIKTTMQLCYDRNSGIWYVGYLDENSIFRVQAGLQEWS